VIGVEQKLVQKATNTKITEKNEKKKTQTQKKQKKKLIDFKNHTKSYRNHNAEKRFQSKSKLIIATE